MINIDASKTISCTGYRPTKFNYNNRIAVDEIKILLHISYVRASYQGYNKILFGGCAGFDLLCAKEAIKFREISRKHEKEFKVICVLPYENFVNNQAVFDDVWRKEYNAVIANCDTVLVIGGQKEYFKGCYSKRNKWLIDNSSRLICLDNGKRGGTYNTLQYAVQQQKHIVNVYPSKKAMKSFPS